MHDWTVARCWVLSGVGLGADRVRVAPMSATVRRRDERGGAWYVYFARAGRRWNKRVGTGPEGEAIARVIAAEFNREGEEAKARQDVIYPGGAAPFDVIARAWWDAKSASMPASTIASKRCVPYERLIPFFGVLDVRRIDDDAVRACAVRQAERGHARETVDTTGSVLDSILSWAVKRGYADRCPALRSCGGDGVVSVFRAVAAAKCKPTKRITAWRQDEAAILLECAAARGPWLADPLLFLFQTGCRRGEMLALEWSDVDLGAGRVLIRQSMTRGQTKTTKADNVRTVELAEDTIRMLRRLAKISRTGKVFRTKRGKPWLDYSFSGYWIRCRREAEKRGVRRFKLHCTRHSWASWALAAGHDAAWAAAQIGDGMQVFLRRYVHVITGTKRSLDFLRLSPRADGAPPAESAGLPATAQAGAGQEGERPAPARVH
jgi:integrase